MTPRNAVLCGDALEVLSTFETNSIDAAITSPPYLLARDYGAGDQELGREDHIDEWVDKLVVVSRDVARVLVPTGSFWLNAGDMYSRSAKLGAPPKSLLLGPERLIRALLDDGWMVRNKVAWIKKSPLPTSVSDRLATTWEPLFHVVRQRDYYYDLDMVREPLTSGPRSRSRRPPDVALGPLAAPRRGLARMALEGRSGHPLGKNPGDVWILPNGRAVGGHRATFPEGLVRRPILATAPLKVCTACGRPWRRSTRRVMYLAGQPQMRPLVPCGCKAPTRPGLVLDPFAGSGTTLKVARELGRDALGIELHPGFADLARQRAGFAEVLAEAA